MNGHDPFCVWTHEGQCQSCDKLAEIRADERNRIADEWQHGGWTAITTKVKAAGGSSQLILGVAQAVTDWLRDPARERVRT